MKLNEVMVAPNEHLTVMQQTCLLKVFLAQNTSPATAAQVMKGNAYLMAAGEYLLNQGILVQANGGLTVSKSGTNQLQLAGLLDENGITEKGRLLVDQKPFGSDQAKPVPSQAAPSPDSN
jgi:hypothetical protein